MTQYVRTYICKGYRQIYNTLKVNKQVAKYLTWRIIQCNYKHRTKTIYNKGRYWSCEGQRSHQSKRSRVRCVGKHKFMLDTNKLSPVDKQNNVWTQSSKSVDEKTVAVSHVVQDITHTIQENIDQNMCEACKVRIPFEYLRPCNSFSLNQAPKNCMDDIRPATSRRSTQRISENHLSIHILASNRFH